MPHLRSISIPRSNYKNGRPPMGSLPVWGSAENSTLPSSANYDCDEDCNGVTLQLTLPLHYTTVHSEVKSPSPGLGRDDGQRRRAAYCAACRAPLGRAMLTAVAL
jgi:hypothetical protein